MEPAAFVWFMIVFGGQGVTTLPVPYQTEEMCKWAAGAGNVVARCVPQPAGDLAQFSYLSSADGFQKGAE